MSIIHNFKHVNLSKTEGFNFQFSSTPDISTVLVLINPFQIFTQIGNTLDPFSNFLSFTQDLFTNEVALRTSSEFNEFRNNLLSITGYPSLPIGKVDSKSSSKGTIKFTKHSAPLSLVLWFPMHFIAFDPETRELFQHYVSNSLKVPTILQELMLRTRISRCGSFNIQPGLDTNSIDSFIDVVAPCLKDTFLDYRFLRTPQGMHSYISFLSMISLADYTTKVVTDVIQNILFDSHFQTTQMSISTTDKNFTTATVMQGNSYANGSPTEIHLIDAIITNQHAYDENFISKVTSLSSTITLNGLSIYTISSYIAKRCLGIVTNSLNLPEEHIVPPPVKAKKPSPYKGLRTPKEPVPKQEQKFVDYLETNNLLNQLIAKFDLLISSLTQANTRQLSIC
jgi:hypothetical protein